ncbi:MAG TPA: response regulator [Bacteroidia bacterium]|nr:response regulator [Bacteroidia bacterium]
MNILIIDDDIFVKKALSFNLLEDGHSVTLAGNGEEAIALIEKNQNFDLIFCDVMMPVLTGPTFLLMLKKYFPFGLPAIVIISGVKDGEDFLHKIEINYDFFIKKPIDMEYLNKIVKKVDEKKNIRR